MPTPITNTLRCSRSQQLVLGAGSSSVSPPRPLQICLLALSHFLTTSLWVFLYCSEAWESENDPKLPQSTHTLPWFPTHSPTQEADMDALWPQILKTVWRSVISYPICLYPGLWSTSSSLLDTPRIIWLSFLLSLSPRNLALIYCSISFFFLMSWSWPRMLFQPLQKTATNIFWIYSTCALTHLIPTTFLREQPTKCSVLASWAGRVHFKV